MAARAQGDGRRRVDGMGASGPAVDQAAQGGPEDDGCLENRGTPSHGVGKMLPGHEQGQESLPGRAVKGAHDAEQNEDEIDGPDRGRAGKGDAEQQQPSRARSRPDSRG